MKINKDPKKGLTIIELLLALSIFAVIAVLVYSTFSGGIRLSARAEKDNQLYREIYWTYEQVTKDFERMVGYDFSNSYPGQLAFQGKSDSFSFLIAADEGIRHVSYKIVDPEKTHIHKVIVNAIETGNKSKTINRSKNIRRGYLVRTEMDFIDYLSGVDSDENEEVLAMHVKERGMEVSYAYREVEGGENIVFKNDWTMKELPARMQLTLIFVADDENPMEFTKDIINPAGAFGEDG